MLFLWLFADLFVWLFVECLFIAWLVFGFSVFNVVLFEWFGYYVCDVCYGLI